MRRVGNLENGIYKTRYREIYKLIFTADIDVINDHSNWLHSGEKNFIDLKMPLWIIMESKILNKRIWITEEWGDLRISTAQLDLDVKSNEYHDSYEHFNFKTQKQLTEKLKSLLEPCLEKELEEDLDIEKD